MKRIIVVLCGSTRFKSAFIEANFRETAAGKIVLSVGWFSHADGHIYSPTEEEKAALDELHLDKIDLADEVLILNCRLYRCGECGGWENHVTSRPCGHQDAPLERVPYIGESTRRELEYARKRGKIVRFLEPEGDASAQP